MGKEKKVKKIDDCHTPPRLKTQTNLLLFTTF